MMDFEEWMAKNYSGAFDMPHPSEAYEAGQQSKQAEIDALKAKVNAALEAFNDGAFNYCQGKLEEVLK